MLNWQVVKLPCGKYRLPSGTIIEESQLLLAIDLYKTRTSTLKEMMREIDAFFRGPGEMKLRSLHDVKFEERLRRICK